MAYFCSTFFQEELAEAVKSPYIRFTVASPNLAISARRASITAARALSASIKTANRNVGSSGSFFVTYREDTKTAPILES